MQTHSTPNPANAAVLQQLAIAQGAVERLSAEGLTVTSLSLAGSTPTLSVTMPPTARCLPGTTIVRRRCELGVQTVQQARAYGCLIHWQVQS